MNPSRRTGFELELSGLSLDELADSVARVVDGTARRDGRFVWRVASSLGEFRVEVDAALLKEERHRSALKDAGFSSRMVSRLEDVLEGLAETVVPMEVVSPPLPPAQHPVMCTLQTALREAGAKGTDAALHYAFGLHLNPEALSRDAEGIGSTLRAFVVLEDALWEKDADSWARKLTPYVDPYPQEYVERVLSPGYAPTLEELARDYLVSNPTRNRSLDLLPLFRDLGLRAVLDHPSSSTGAARPTYHYRLPSSRIDDPEWSILEPLRHWCAVERLAGDSARLEAACAAYRRERIEPLIGCSRRTWVERVEAEGWLA